jgi:hypothetical protein
MEALTLIDFKERFIATIGSGTGHGSSGIALAEAKRLMMFVSLMFMGIFPEMYFTIF